jgi:hypothetical protein
VTDFRHHPDDEGVIDAYWYEDSGEPPWCGFVLVDQPGELLDRHVFESWLAGIAYHEAAQSDSFAPGEALRIVPEPDNPHDPNALGVCSADGSTQGGWVPSAVAAKMTPAERHGIVLGELIDDGHRVVVAMAVGRTELRLNVLTLTDAAQPHVAHVVRRYRHGLAVEREAVRFKEEAANAFEQLTRGAP